MTLHSALDHIGWNILTELQNDARLSFTQLGRRVGLSTPAVKQRVLRLEEAGIITGYHAAVNPRLAGYPISAFVRITVSGDERTAKRLAATAAEMPEVMECHRCTGDHAFILKVDAASITALEKLIDRLTAFGMTSTSLILSSPVERSVITEPPAI